MNIFYISIGNSWYDFLLFQLWCRQLVVFTITDQSIKGRWWSPWGRKDCSCWALQRGSARDCSHPAHRCASPSWSHVRTFRLWCSLCNPILIINFFFFIQLFEYSGSNNKDKEKAFLKGKELPYDWLQLAEKLKENGIAVHTIVNQQTFPTASFYTGTNESVFTYVYECVCFLSCCVRLCIYAPECECIVLNIWCVRCICAKCGHTSVFSSSVCACHSEQGQHV